MIKRVTIFCASSRMVDEKYYADTRQLAKILVKNEITAVYGGGAVGLMGELADTMLHAGGLVEGVIPEFMMKVEWGHKSIKKMTIVKDMHERKKLLIDNTDGVIALPGGTGTLEELMEVISLKRLGKFVKPIIILNTDGFYDTLIEFFEKMIEEKFLRAEHRAMWTVIDTPDKLMDAFRNAAGWDEDAINIAAVS
jgi:uncharacterized protein (TIGR00730 family)